MLTSLKTGVRFAEISRHCAVGSHSVLAGFKETMGLFAFYILTKTSNNGRGRRSVFDLVRLTQNNLILAPFIKEVM